MKVYESEEMYLETILSLKNKKSLVRSVDIVEEQIGRASCRERV